MQYEAGSSHGSHTLTNLPPPLQSIIQDEPLQSHATLVPPLASYPPLGTNYLCIPYMSNFAMPSHCMTQEKVVTNGIPNGSLRECDFDMEEEKKPDKEHKKRSKNWTRSETLKLIKLRTEMASKFNKTGRKSDLWEQIARSLQQESINRDAQQCRDKWEKLMAGFKEVKDGVKGKEEYSFYEDLYPLLSGKLLKRDRDTESNEAGTLPTQQHVGGTNESDKEGPSARFDCGSDRDEDGDLEQRPAHKRKKYVTVTDLQAVQAMLEMVISQQQRIFKDFLDTLERKEQQREKIRQEREEKWKAEELAQRRILNDAMIMLTQKLVSERIGDAAASLLSTPVACNQRSADQSPMAAIKRSSWKSAEVLQLIKLRGEMESRFAKSTRRTPLWEEVSESLSRLGLNRDSKQCKEKWDKLVAEYKDVIDGKREEAGCPYFHELTAIMRNRPADIG
ncbi:hypothetical protein KP509_09G097500 [Ceratopteris richardii]|nr:hypothetical protein KP509_09G097500 [Ceratopteris richardii]